ncbi:MAG: hypothetical protein Q8M92_01570 [Candidatus Subteraquimicrobiales bacterium]|nr:hypothetical protein [Candidatus Subteraquimicrobiales bacterium]
METGLNCYDKNVTKKLFILADSKEVYGEIMGDRIRLLVDEVHIEGIITSRKTNEICISITKPFDGLTECSNSIPLLLSRFLNYSGDKGNKKAMLMLYDIYKFCSYVEANLTEIATAFDRYNLKIDYETFFEPSRQQKQERIHELLNNVLAIRKKLKTGEIDNLIYQRQIKPINNELKTLGKETEIDTDRVFHECFWGYRNTPLELVSKENVVMYLTRYQDLH